MNRLTALALTCALMFPFNLLGDETPAPAFSSPFNLEGPTFGGKQLWTDELVFHEWRVQRNTLSGHCRLLDDKNFRKAWGSFEHCRKQLEAAPRPTPRLSPANRMKNRYAILSRGCRKEAGMSICDAESGSPEEGTRSFWENELIKRYKDRLEI